MANVLKLDKQVAIITAFVEGASVRSTERMVGVHRDSCLRLMNRVAIACAAFSDRTLRNLDCRRIEVDELWGYVGKKNRNVTAVDNWTEVGDQYVFIGIDPVSKLVPSYEVGKRTAYTTMRFIDDLSSRLKNRIQLSSDGFLPYAHAVQESFGHAVDYGVIVKKFAEQPTGRGRYSPPRFIESQREDVIGSPNVALICTSHSKRFNATVRLHNRRLSRLTLAFSRKLENFKASLDVYFAAYNFTKFHRSIGCTPAMQAGVVNSPMTIKDLVEMAA